MRQTLFLLFSFLMLVFTQATAEIHKCTAGDGSVQFSDVPCGEQGTAYRQKQLRTTPNAMQRNIKRDRLLRAYEQERREQQQAEADARQEKLVQTRNCAQARDYLQQISRASGVYQLDENGKREMLDQDARKQALTDAQADVAYWCK